MLISLTVAVMCLCTLLVAQDEKEERFLPKGVRESMQVFERDCPMCGWNFRKKRSNDKPSKEFKGAFEPGTVCPLCGGIGKVRETVSWVSGYAQAYGVGIPDKRSAVEDPGKRKAQDYLMAKKAAEVRAARNAVAMLAKIKLARNKDLSARDYQHSIEATVKGAEYDEVKSDKDAQKPYHIARVRIPLWGVKGLSSTLWAAYSKSYGATGHASAPREELEEEYVIIIDARGSECPPHLFPRIITEKGAVVYDISKVHKDTALENGMASFGYLEEDIPFEKLDESMKQSLADINGSFACWQNDQLLEIVLDGDEEDEKDEKDKPKKKKRRRKRINLIVKGAKTDKKDASVVVSESDAKKMQDADEKTDSLKGGKVIILTDSRVAGKEGRIITKRTIRLACRKVR